MNKAEDIKRYEKQNKKSECITRQLTDEEKIKYGLMERKTMNKELKIDPELRDLLPPLTEEEFKKLEERILKDGCQTPLFIWQGYIADGHNRFAICIKHNIQFQTIELAYRGKSEVMHWMIDTQLGRRNLSPIQRIGVAEKYRNKFEEEAKERKSLNGGDKKSEISERSTPIKKTTTEKELAKIAEVGFGTMARYNYVMNHGDEELKQKMLNDKIPITAAYDSLKQKENKEKESKKEDINVEDKTIQESVIQIGLNQEEKQIEQIQTSLSCDEDKLLEDINFKHNEYKICEQEENEKQNNIETDDSLDDKIKEIVKDLKTFKSVNPIFNFTVEFQCIQENMRDYIDNANEVLFERHDYTGEIEQTEKDNAIIGIQDLVVSLKELENKILNLRIKGE